MYYQHTSLFSSPTIAIRSTKILISAFPPIKKLKICSQLCPPTQGLQDTQESHHLCFEFRYFSKDIYCFSGIICSSHRTLHPFSEMLWLPFPPVQAEALLFCVCKRLTCTNNPPTVGYTPEAEATQSSLTKLLLQFYFCVECQWESSPTVWVCLSGSQYKIAIKY